MADPPKVRTFVVVSRKYSGLEIRHRVIYTSNEILIECDLKEFLESLAQELGPSVSLTRKALTRKLLDKSESVIAEMKKATIHAPPPIKV
jgi:hypothetical protein